MPEAYLGPLFSAGGLRTWDCWLSPESILTVRHGPAHMLRLNAWQYLGFPADPTGPPPRRRNGDRIYRLSRLQAVEVRRRRLSHSEVLLILVDGTRDLYGILDHARTDDCRGKLSAWYPALYRERGFESVPVPTGS